MLAGWVTLDLAQRKVRAQLEMDAERDVRARRTERTRRSLRRFGFVSGRAVPGRLRPTSRRETPQAACAEGGSG